MRKFLLIILISTSSFYLKGQSPKAFKYQAVARDENGSIIANTDLSIRISILEDLIEETSVYSETHNVRANAHGLINLIIGKGTVEYGSIEAIDWANNNFQLQVEVADLGSAQYQILGKSQLVSVPYALYANKAGNVFSGNYNDLTNTPHQIDTNSFLKEESDPVYSTSIASKISAADTFAWNNKLDFEVDGSITNEIQQLLIENDSLKLSHGNGIKLSSIGSSPWNINGDSIFYTSGNVGIGTTNPDYKLDVDGTIRAEEVIVEDVGADFVFEPDYKLLPLKEVEDHINIHGHLPGIAPAHITEKGVRLSEFNEVLLQKIEELTLYIIEQQKEIDALKAKNNQE